MNAKAIFAVCLATLVAASACCCCDLPTRLATGLGGGGFASGDLPDVPAYPGATQSTEGDAALNLMVTILSAVGQSSEWRHYTTSDSSTSVLDWYSDELPFYGWTALESSAEFQQVEMQGGRLFYQGDLENEQRMLIVMAVPSSDGSGKTEILIGDMAVTAEENAGN